MDTIIRFFQEGGAFMYPITLVLALGIAVTVERYIYLTRVRSMNNSTWNQLVPLLNKGDLVSAVRLVESSKSHIAHVVSYGLNQRRTSYHREDIETAMEEGLMEILPKLEKRTHYIATFANLATLLGLLGTIIGLIQAFTAVANADPAEKANLLSASIAVAMNTTAYGLIVAIPLLLIYAVIQSKTTDLTDSIEMAAVKIVNLISGEPKKSGVAQ
ncbi:MAG: MotA/TolQ/ExbB proton channel family protein [Pseudomonadota bacterium]